MSFPEEQSQRGTLDFPQGTATVEGVENRLRALSPQNDAQRLLQSRALQISGEVAQARWLAIEQAENTIPTVFLVVLVFWVATMFASRRRHTQTRSKQLRSGPLSPPFG